MIKRGCLFLISSLLLLQAIAQREGTKWYFGYGAGIDFASGTPYPTRRGKLFVEEGCSSVADAQGRLLFYSGANNVFNADHQVMPNGSTLQGDPSATQSNLILPWPERAGFYFVFTTGSTEDNFFTGVRYSIVDMAADNGKGDVIVRNLPLFSPAPEKMIGIPHANGCDVWMLTHEYDSDAFRAYLIDSSGVDVMQPVITNIGSSHTGIFLDRMNTFVRRNARGEMAVNLSGTQVAAAIHEDGLLEVFDFNGQTGELTNPISLEVGSKIYGVAFSPSGRFLYASVSRNGRIYQYDLLAGNGSQADVQASGQVIGTSATLSVGSIQLAPDGRIYVARQFESRLGVVEFPDRQGLACSYVDDGFELRGITTNRGLPNIYGPYLTPPPFNSWNDCVQEPIFFNFDERVGIDSVKWDFGDPTAGLANTSTSFTPRHRYPSEGDYQVQLVRFRQGQADTAFKTVQIKSRPQIDLPQDTILCEEASWPISFDFEGKDIAYLWQDGSTESDFTIDQPGRYFVAIRNECGSNRGQVDVQYLSPPQVNIGPDQGLCEDSVLTLTAATPELGTLMWQDGSMDNTFVVTSPGSYFVEAENVCGTDMDSVMIFPDNCKCVMELSNVFTPNGDGINEAFVTRYQCDLASYKLAIFDRWGHEVFQSDSPVDAWQGQRGSQDSPIGVYYYVLRYQGTHPTDNEPRTLKGSVVLMR
ncbi:MAG: gliding motility-associated C-terminal domain-containing protein [Bacteroidota bacterium]